MHISQCENLQMIPIQIMKTEDVPILIILQTNNNKDIRDTRWESD